MLLVELIDLDRGDSYLDLDLSFIRMLGVVQPAVIGNRFIRLQRFFQVARIQALPLIREPPSAEHLHHFPVLSPHYLQRALTRKAAQRCTTCRGVVDFLMVCTGKVI
jgi:hypothetical protein